MKYSLLKSSRIRSKILGIILAFAFICGVLSNATIMQTALATSGSGSGSWVSTSDTGSTTTLQVGSKGEDVKSLQLRLIQLGYLIGKADGDFGKKTQKAVMAYQEAVGYTEIDGIATAELLVEIFSSGALGADGEYHDAYVTPTAAPKASNNQKQTTSSGDYIANTNTGKFHRAGCGSVKKMKDSNKAYYNSREACINDGYIPCKKCNP